MRQSRVGRVCACLCLVSLALAAAQASAQVMKRGAGEWDRIAFVSERLNPPALTEPLESSEAAGDWAIAQAWRMFELRHDGTWTALVDRRNGRLAVIEGSGIPLVPGYGNHLTPSAIAGRVRGRRDVTLDTVLDLVRTLYPQVASLLGPQLTRLQLNPGRSGEVGGYLWLVDLDLTTRDGLPIEGARVVFRINNGNLVQIAAENVPPPGTREPRFKLGRDEALAVVDAALGGLSDLTDGFLDPGSRHVLPVVPADAPGRGSAPFGKGLELAAVWEFVIVRDGVAGTWRARVDAETGELLELADTNWYATAQVTGGVYPISLVFNDETILPMPFADLSSGGAASSAGLYDYTGGTVTSTLNAPYVRIVDTCGSISQASDGSGNIAFGSGSGTDCSTPGHGGAGNTHASRMQFYHVNRAKEKGRAWLPGVSWLSAKLTVNVNLNTSCSFFNPNFCNAYWNGSTLNFLKYYNADCSGYNFRCNNTGEVAGISLHEYGHGLDANDGNGSSPDKGTGETYGDFTATLQTHTSCVGPGFDADGGNCSGYGDACTSCTGVRDIDWAAHSSNTPHTVANFTQPRCPTSFSYQGPCGREGHCESYVSSEALWDLAARDLPARGFAADAWTITDRLWYLSRPSAGTAFVCSTSGTWSSHGCAAGTYWRVMRAVDDDDGNLANGTPHSCALYDAFNRHGIACTSDAGASTCYSGCTPPSAPSLTATPGDNQVSLSWSGSSGVYDVFRNEAGCSAGFTKIAEDLSTTSYLDTAVANGYTYYYIVTAHPSGNEACSSPPSTCRSATPAPCTPPSAPGGVSAAANGNNRIDVSWTNVGGVGEYHVYRATASGGPYSQVGTVGSTPYVDTDVGAGVTYYYVVRSFATCESGDSSIVSATAQGTCDLAPLFGGVTSVTAPLGSACTLQVGWSAATAQCGGPVTYAVYRSTASAFTPSLSNRVAVGLTGTSFTDTGNLASGTDYYYIVHAVDTANNAEDANSTTLGSTPLGPLTDGTWSTGAETGDPTMTMASPWSTTASRSHSGSRSYSSGYDNNQCAALTTPSLTLTSGQSPTLTYWTAWDIENRWDGGVVEISTNGGGSWSRLTPSPGYPGSFRDSNDACGYANNTPSYTGTGNLTFQQYTVNLSSYAGQTVLIRWSFSTDESVTYQGWFVDDISITHVQLPGSCGAAPEDVQAFTARSTSGTNKLEWRNPASGSYGSAIVRYNTVTAGYPASPSGGDGGVTCSGQSTTAGAYNSCLHSGLANGTEVRYAVFVDNGAGVTSGGVTVAATPIATTGPAKWSYSTGAAAMAPPGVLPGGVGTGSVYQVSNDRVLHGMNPTQSGGDWPRGVGAFDWYPMAMNGPAQHRPPVVPLSAGPRIFLASQDGYAYCANADTGAVVWTSNNGSVDVQLGAMLQANPAGLFSDLVGGAPNLVLFGTRDATAANTLYALDPSTGVIQSAMSFANGSGQNPDGTGGIGIITGITVDYAGQRAFFTSRAWGAGSPNTVWCVDLSGGDVQRVWSQSYTGDVDAAPVLAGGVLYVGANSGTVYAMNPSNGAKLWEFSTGDGPIKGYVVPDVAASRLYLSTTNGVWGLHDNGGSATQLWHLTSISSPSTPTFMPGAGVVLVGGGGGTLYQLDPSAGNPDTTKKSVSLTSVKLGSPAVDVINGLAHVGSTAGVVYAVAVPLP